MIEASKRAGIEPPPPIFNHPVYGHHSVGREFDTIKSLAEWLPRLVEALKGERVNEPVAETLLDDVKDGEL